MSKKVKGIILSILLVLCLGGIILEIKFLYPKYVKKEPNLSNNKQQIGDKTNNDQNDKQDDRENDNNNNQENKTNVYDKYPDIKWAGTSFRDFLKIVDGKLECSGYLTEVCDLNSSIDEPIKKISYAYVSNNYYRRDFYILTESGKVFRIYFDSVGEINSPIQINQIMTEYTVIDMTEPYNNYRYGSISRVVNTMWMEVTAEDVYFLTQDGKLISQDEDTYEFNNRDFVRSNCFNYDGQTSLLFCLYYDKESHVSYKFKNRNEDLGDYKDWGDYKDYKNKLGEDLVAKYVYDSIEESENNPFERKTLIIDENDDLYVIEYINNDFPIKYLGKVTSVTCDKTNWMLTFKLSDGNTYQFKSAEIDYFDVASKKAVPFNSN